MHGRPRKSPVTDAARQKDEHAKLARIEALLGELLRNHRERNYSKGALQQSAKLLETNPDVYTAWNFRKRAVKHMLDLEVDHALRKSIVDEELQVVERALARNYKSYGAWHHRKWVISFGLSSLNHEYQLLEKLLSADPRNFLGWDYRRFIANVKGATKEEELQYTIKKINENFSNYSAWHYRSALLSKQFVVSGEWQKEILMRENELVKQAFFTEPEDQSGWFYLLWLLKQTVPTSVEIRPVNDVLVQGVKELSIREDMQSLLDKPIDWVVETTESCWSLAKDEFNELNSEPSNRSPKMSSVWQVEILEDQIKTCRDLLDVEPNSKWTKLTLARLLIAHDTVVISVVSHKQHVDEVRHHFMDLISMDPTHQKYYEEQLSLILIDEITSDKQKLSLYWKDSSSSEIEGRGWLRLCGLSLTKLGYLERLSWVRKLDLSNNKLQCLEGMEAFRVLIFLDISHNHILSVAALSPISAISTLKALNIKYNEIGAHAIDTHRYMFPSLLNNSIKVLPSSVEQLYLWQLSTVLGGMQLQQIDIQGNPIANYDGVKHVIQKALPFLVWLDGEKV